MGSQGSSTRYQVLYLSSVWKWGHLLWI